MHSSRQTMYVHKLTLHNMNRFCLKRLQMAIKNMTGFIFKILNHIKIFEHGIHTFSEMSVDHMQNVVRSNEPPHDKTNKMSVRPAKTQISLGIRPVWMPRLIRVFTVHLMGS